MYREDDEKINSGLNGIVNMYLDKALLRKNLIPIVTIRFIDTSCDKIQSSRGVDI